MLRKTLNIRCVIVTGLLFLAGSVFAQKDYQRTKSVTLDVNDIDFTISTRMGDGGMASMYSWNLTGNQKQDTEEWFFPQDRWYSNMLFHLYNIICYDDSGFVNQDGERVPRVWLRSEGFVTDYSWERRRYRPPEVTVDDIELVPAYRWDVDPDLPADEVVSFEDIYRNRNLFPGYGGIRVKVNIYALQNPNHSNYIIWEQTMKFTGELWLDKDIEGERTQDEHYLPDQTVNLWWGFTTAFGPTKAGEYFARGFFGYEPEDDLDSWFKQRSDLVPNRSRDSLLVAYYWDTYTSQLGNYSNDNRPGWSSSNDAGDPSKVNGHLFSTQIPGFTILEVNAPRSNTDDLTQPYSAPHANIAQDFFGRRTDFNMRNVYIGHSQSHGGKFPKDVRTEGLNNDPEKGSLRMLTVGPYALEKNAAQGNYDSIKVVYAIGVGDVGYEVADSLGKGWFEGDIDDAGKDMFIPMGRDSLFQALDRANWAWNTGLNNIPAPPPPPDLVVNSGPKWNEVSWSYPENRYYEDFNTGVDDFYGWKVYRKQGAVFVDDPDDDHKNFTWELVYETDDRTVTTYLDSSAERGVSYYYAVTGIDDGSQNTDGLFPGQQLESSRFANRSTYPAIRYEPGLNTTDKVRVVPNPASIAASRGPLGFPGEPNKLLFVNLPTICKLNIYTETGELVKSWYHEGSADDTWDQRTNENQQVTSGIYILAVTEARDSDNNPLPNQFIKFVLVR